MKRKIAAIAIAMAVLMGGAVPASAHTTHSHKCWSAPHAYQLDGGGWKHNAYRTISGGYQWVGGYHYQWVALDGGFWLFKHSFQTPKCAI